MAGEAGRVEEAFRIGCAADQRVVVGAHLVIAPPRRLHRQVEDHRQPAHGVLGDLLQRRLLPAEDEPRAFAVEVEGGGEVDRQRQPLGKATVLRTEPHVPLLALDRQLEAGHRRDLVRPLARAADDRAAREVTLGGLDPGDAPVLDPDASHLAALADVDPRAYHCTTDSGDAYPSSSQNVALSKPSASSCGTISSASRSRARARGRRADAGARARPGTRRHPRAGRAGTGSRTGRSSIPSICSNSSSERSAIRMFSSSENCVRIPRPSGSSSRPRASRAPAGRRRRRRARAGARQRSRPLRRPPRSRLRASPPCRASLRNFGAARAGRAGRTAAPRTRASRSPGPWCRPASRRLRSGTARSRRR